MPYLTIGKHDYDRSWTSPGPRGVARIFRQGTHEVSEELAEMAREEAPAFVRITDADPGDADTHRRGPLTRDEIDMGTRAADEKARADRLAAEVDRLTKEAEDRDGAVDAGDPEQVDPFYCDFCEDRFPTEAARDRHQEMQHESEPDPAPAPKPAAKPRVPRKKVT